MRLRGVPDLFGKWDTTCMVMSVPESEDAFPLLTVLTREGPQGEQRVRALVREIHEEGAVVERYVLAPADGWIAYEVPLAEAGWHLSVLFVRDEREQLVLAEVKVFPGRNRTRITPKKKWVGAVHEVTPEHLDSLGWVLAGQWSGDITGEDCKGITARMLRANLQLGEVQQRVSALVFTAAEVTFGIAPEFASLDRPMATGSGPADASYALWAARYLDAIAHGSTSPNRYVGERYGLSAARVRDRVHIARTRGLLTGGGKGRQGGVLTDKARHLLAGLSEDVTTKKTKKTTTKKKGS